MTSFPLYCSIVPRRTDKARGLSPLFLTFVSRQKGTKVLQENKGFLIYFYIYIPLYTHTHTPACVCARARPLVRTRGGMEEKGSKGGKVFSCRFKP